MKNKYILVWETDNHETKVKSADTLMELYIFSLTNDVRGEYFKQVQIAVVEK